MDLNDSESPDDILCHFQEIDDVEITVGSFNDVETSTTSSMSPVDSETFNNSHSNKVDSVGDGQSAMLQMPMLNPNVKTNALYERFLSIDDLFAAMLNAKSVLNTVPLGTKENQYFIINNEENLKYYKEKKKCSFPDDCGIWDWREGRTATSYYEVRGKHLVHLLRKDGIYGKDQTTFGMRNFMPCIPQPVNVAILHRYYATLKRDKNYKKRVNFFVQLPFENNDIINCAVVEYLRTLPVETFENAETGCNELIPTSPSVAQRIAGERNGEKTTGIADQSLALLSVLNAHAFVQEVIFTKSKPASVILYTEDQVADMRYCQETGGILGVDNTFYLGNCFITTFVFQNRKLIDNESRAPPVFLGPVYIHWDRQMDTYCKFFSHIACKLHSETSDYDFKLPSDIDSESDEDSALRRAIEIAFPKMKRYLHTDNKHGRTQKRKIKTETISGDAIEPNQKKFDSQTIWNTSSEKHVWMNNNGESINEIILLDINWTPQEIPQLLEKLYAIVELQYSNMWASLHGYGDYSLHEDFSDEDKKTLHTNFMSCYNGNSKLLNATSGLDLLLPNSHAITKKSNHTKRSRSTRTNTDYKRKKQL